MGKASRLRAEQKRFRLTDHEQLAQAEGELVVSFIFDGQVHKRTHQFNAGEIQRLKEMCVEAGDAAADQVLWRLAVRNAGWFAENVLAVAGKAYVLKHHVNAKEEEQKMQTVFDTPAPSYSDLLNAENESERQAAEDVAVSGVNYAKLELRVAASLSPEELAAFENNGKYTNRS